jgi:putative MATE family efflux protein
MATRPYNPASSTLAARASSSSALDALLHGPLTSQLLRLAIPNLTPFGAILVLVSIDAVVIGRLGKEALAGLSLVFPFLMLSQTMAAGGVGSAVASTIARASSAGDHRYAQSLALHGLIIALAVGAISGLLMACFGRSVFVAMGASGDVLDSAVLYATLTFLGAAAPWVLNVAASISRGVGNMRSPAAAMILSALIYSILCPVTALGFGPVRGFGVSGAALAFVASYAIGGLFLLRSLFSSGATFRLSVREFVPSTTAFREILKLAALGAANATLSNATALVTTGFIGHLGPSSLAGYGLGSRLEYVVIALSFAVGSALVTVVGANVGADQQSRAKRAAWIGALITAIGTTLIGGLAALFPRAWLSLFTSDVGIIQAGSIYLQVVGPFYGCFGFGLALYFAALGAGRPAVPVSATILRLCIVVVGLHSASSSLGHASAVIAAGFLIYGVIIFCGTRLTSWQRAA